FKGHFPRYPLLPGIVQIEIALFCISMRLNKEAKLAEIVKTKFIKPALPDTELCVSLSGTGEIFDITVKDANEIYSHMRLRVAV
ncbi:MAG: hypothetical protein FWC57_04740, partial [Endomicrobia bacterium]|nr:hypothetical protein [Endomicrobiia bacterium]